MAHKREHDPAVHAEIRVRELALAEQHQAAGQEAQHAAIADDRAARWAALLAARTELGPIVEWGKRMADRYGATAKVWRTKGLSWIAALYIVRYGEAESFWPPQLTLDDLTRARQWERGDGWPAYVVGEV